MSACHEASPMLPNLRDAAAHVVDAVSDEPKRLLRGYNAMRSIFGYRFTLAVVAVLLLLLAAIAFQHGPFAFVVSLVAALLVIRAHDLGDELEAMDEDDDSEYGTFWRGRQWTDAERAALLAKRMPAVELRRDPVQMPAADSALWERRRHETAFGKIHEPPAGL